MGRPEKSRQLRSHLSEIVPDGVERLADEPEVLETLAPSAPASAREGEVARAHAAAHRLATGEDLDEDEMFLVEAIVLPEGRPAFDIQEDSFTPPTGGLWSELGSPEVKARIDAAIPCVGRWRSTGSPPATGTCCPTTTSAS